jgi:hypothetical protein
MSVYLPPGERLPRAADAFCEAHDLHDHVLQRASANLAFFVRGVLGLRRFATARLVQLQALRVAPTAAEARVLESWDAFRRGESVDGVPGFFRLRRSA